MQDRAGLSASVKRVLLGLLLLAGCATPPRDAREASSHDAGGAETARRAAGVATSATAGTEGIAAPATSASVAPAAAEADPCPHPDKIPLEDAPPWPRPILFAPKSASIAWDQQWELEFMAATLSSRTEERHVRVKGSGSADEGDWKKLAHDRASTVIDALVRLGVGGDRLELVDADAPLPRDEVRRVEFQTTERAATPNPLCRLPFKGYREVPAELPPIYFSPNSAAPFPIAQAQFRGIREMMKDHPEYDRLELRGLVAPDEHEGARLAQKRVDATVAGLVAEGFPREKIVPRITPRVTDVATPHVGVTLLPPPIPAELLKASTSPR